MSDSKSSTPAGAIRVMVVDDSLVIRGLIARMLETDPAIKVVTTVANGDLAVKEVKRQPIDVVVLDIEMPVMDGLTALPLILAASPRTKVIMASTLTQRNASISIEALSKGASDYIPKPTSSREVNTSDDFKRDIILKVKTLGRLGAAPPRGDAASTPATATAVPGKPAAVAKAPIALRRASALKPEILAIGSSTGGPPALLRVFEMLGGKIPVPVVIAQHMPPMFTAILAEHLGRFVGGRAKEGADGEPLAAGTAYIAPGGRHMVVGANGTAKVIRLNDDPPENFCRPAVDPLFRSVAALYGARALAVVLTGMGADGLRGGQSLVDAGGTVIAQDEATSVVWGMPGAVATAGICSAVLPLDGIAPAVQRAFAGVAI
jgi:two-component system chemotaxis response regulator CheB